MPGARGRGRDASAGPGPSGLARPAGDRARQPAGRAALVHRRPRAAALYRFWELRAHLSEGSLWFDAALAQSAEVSAAVRAQALHGAGILARASGAYARAIELVRASLALRRELGDRAGEALALNALGNVAADQADYDGAQALFEQSLALRRELRDAWGIALALHNVGAVAAKQRDDQRAVALLEESLARFRELGDAWGIALALENRANVARSVGAHDQAVALYAEGLRLFAETRTVRGIAACLEGLGEVASSQRQFERAARLLGAAEALRGSQSAALAPADQDDLRRAAESARRALGETAFAAHWAAGRALPLDGALLEALRPVDGPVHAPAPRRDGLTDREREIAALVAHGLANRQIARELVVSERTVEWHVANIRGKLGLQTRAQIAVWALEHGLTAQPDRP